MQLKWPYLLILILPIAAAAVWRLRKPAPKPVRLVGETDTLHSLPSYKKVERRTRALAATQTVLLALLMASLVVIAARPQQQIRKVDNKNARDIVLCLDASGSMTNNLPDALTAMSDIVKANPTDRYGLVIFQNVPYVALPLTSDIAAITLKTNDLAAQFKTNGTAPAFLAGFQPDVGGGGTDIGAGLAGCVRRFDNLDQPRSRHIIMLSDMQNNGLTDEAAVASLLPKYNIKLHILAPSAIVSVINDSDVVAQITGASVDSFNDGGGVRSVLNQIFASILSQQKAVQFVSVDAPYAWWIAVISLTALWAAAQMIRWRQRV